MNIFNRTFLLTLVIFISGCAYPPEHWAKQAKSLSDFDACKWYLHPIVTAEQRVALENEVKSRGITCQNPSYYGVSSSDISRKQQQNLQMMQQGLQMMQPQQQNKQPSPNVACMVSCANKGNMSAYCESVCSYDPAPY